MRRFALAINFDSALGSGLTSAQQQPAGEAGEGVESRIELRGIPDSNVWAYGSYSGVDNDHNSAGDDQRYNGDVITFSAGLDHWFNDKILGGMAVSYSNTQLRTFFNNKGNYREERLHRFALRALQIQRLADGECHWGGNTFSNINQDRNDVTVTSETDAHTAFGTVTARARHQLKQMPKLGIVGRVSFLMSHRWINSFTESDATKIDSEDSDTGELRLGGEVNYRFDRGRNTFLP